MVVSEQQETGSWLKFIFDDTVPFGEKALKVFYHQYHYNAVYRRFCDSLKRTPDRIDHHLQIPLLPVEAFKDADVRSFGFRETSDLVFKSSGTGNTKRSVHKVLDKSIYRHSVIKGFEMFYKLGPSFTLLAYLPGYSENPYSSLIWMVRELIRHSSTDASGFLSLNRPLSQQKIDEVAASGSRLLLFGAAFGLLDLVEMSSVVLPEHSLVIETGGMKTHRREIGRKAIHQQLADGFSLPLENIHSEYGMAEMLSQAYATGNSGFRPVPWLQISVRDPHDPFNEVPSGEEGLIGIYDLANIHSCSFLLTGDKGVQWESGSFDVLGRWKSDNLRGCNFLIEEEQDEHIRESD